MFDMRYHIVSLVAVFLALSLGILVGTSIVNKGVLVKEQQRLVDSINESIKKVKENNKQLNIQVDAYKDFEDSVFRNWSPNKLKAKRIGIVIFSNDNDREQESKTAEWLEASGAQTTIIDVQTSFFGKKLKENTSIIKLMPNVPKEKLDEQLIITMVKEMAGKQKISVLTKLIEQKAINVNDEKIFPLDGIVFVAGSRTSKATEDTELLIASNANNIVRTVAVESSNIIPSGLNPFIDKRLSTVDNIDCGTGGISIVSLLIDKKGNYGIKEDAQLISPLSE